MRQAGRYLPEYRQLRKQARDFLTLCYTPELAAQVSLQPIQRFGFDAAILFADILLVPHSLGTGLRFVDGLGPRLSPITGQKDVGALRPVQEIDEVLAPVYETVAILSDALPRTTTLIGFAGAPWTVATYMIAGRGVPGQIPALRFIAEQRDSFDHLLGILTKATIHYLQRQILAGAEVVMLFDSWAGSLVGAEFERYVEKPTLEIVRALKKVHPEVPIITFPRGAGQRLRRFSRSCCGDCIALDEQTDPLWANAQIDERICIQGNLHPEVLIKGGSKLVRTAQSISDNFSGRPHIFNLGHGIRPGTSIRHVEILVQTVREYRPGRIGSPLVCSPPVHGHK